MALNSNQVEQQLTQRRLDIDSLTAKVLGLTSAITQLQNTVSTLNTPAVPGGGGTTIGDDTYQVAGGILHKLVTKFTAAVTFAASAIFSSLTASRPLKLDAGGAVTSSKIDLSAPTTDIQNKLTLANGGTNADLGATGGTSQVLKQLSAGAAITVGQLATTNISDITSGTFTPAVNFGGAATGITYSTQSGKYLKIGSLVYISIQLIMTSKGSATGGATISGLPFQIGAYSSASIGFGSGFSLLAGALTAYFPLAAFALTIWQFNVAGVTTVDDTNFTNTTQLVISAVYSA